MRSSTAILTLRTLHYWTIQANGQKWEDFLNDVFVQLEKNKITDLIIDMRNNHGGHDVLGMLMMSHLHDAAFNYYKKRSSLLKPRGKVIKAGNIYEIEGRGEWTGEVRPIKPLFQGKVYVLMNGYCASAAGEFIGQLKNANRATFIGEEAGGNPVIFMGGQTVRVDLPNTHMTGFLPFVLVEMDVRMKNTGHGVLPDHEVVPTIAEILAEKDVMMEFALKLIEETKK
ncbi:MAG TPA: S41 family peptidase [Cyclobacteriaceae bacterium]|nr:S41 family peptidase [Cyclobacteriaceae bacterium]